MVIWVCTFRARRNGFSIELPEGLAWQDIWNAFVVVYRAMRNGISICSCVSWPFMKYSSG